MLEMALENLSLRWLNYGTRLSAEWYRMCYARTRMS